MGPGSEALAHGGLGSCSLHGEALCGQRPGGARPPWVWGAGLHVGSARRTPRLGGWAVIQHACTGATVSPGPQQGVTLRLLPFNQVAGSTGVFRSLWLQRGQRPGGPGLGATWEIWDMSMEGAHGLGSGGSQAAGPEFACPEAGGRQGSRAHL